MLNKGELFKSLAEKSHDVLYRYEIAPERQFSFVNPSCKELTGYTPEEFYADANLILKLIHPDDIHHLKVLLQGNTTPSYPEKLRIRCRDGAEKWVEWTSIPVLDSEGKAIAIEGIIRDITSNKRTEEILKENQARNKLFMDSTADIAFLKDESFRYIMINRSGLAFFGKTELDEVVGKSDSELLPFEYAHQCDMSDKQALNQNGLVLSIEVIQGRYYETRKFGVNLQEGKVGVGGFIRDVTEREMSQLAIANSERKYRNLVENSLIGVYSTNTKGDFLFANNAICKIFEFESPASILQVSIKSLYRNPADREAFLKTLNEHSSLVDYELDMVTKDGKVRSVIVSATLTGKVISGMMLDITDRKQAEIEIVRKNKEIEAQNREYKTLNEQLMEAKQRAEEADRLKSSFLANMSHEVRTPMNGIIGFADLLSDENLTDDDRGEYVEIIQSSGQQLLKIISDLMDISKIEANQIDLEVEEVDINHLLDNVYKLFTQTACEKTINFFFDKRLPEDKSTIFTDSMRVRQILSNLLNNAFKFTNSGHVAFGCELKDGSVEFFVEDTGIGIPTEIKGKVFDRFHQVESKLTRRFGGTGLGLAISKAFVEMLGGDISFKSTPEKGSIFYFTLPVSLNTDSAPNPKPLPKEREYPQLARKQRIIIAEDSEMNFIYLQELLSEMNTEIIRAKDGVEAVELVKSSTEEIDLILMDIRMPRMDGYEATRQIKSIKSDILIIAQTAHALSEDKRMAREAGCDDFIAKPILKHKLIGLMKKHFVMA